MKNIFLSISLLLLVFLHRLVIKIFLIRYLIPVSIRLMGLNTPQQYLAHVNNLYSQLQNPVFYGGRFIVFNEQRADEFGRRESMVMPPWVLQSGIRMSLQPNEYINGVWSAAYTAINAANILMLKLSDTRIISDSLSRLLYRGVQIYQGFVLFEFGTNLCKTIQCG